MATVVKDHFRLIDFVEENGAIERMNRACLITGLANANSDYRTLNECLAALDSEGLTYGSTPTGMSNLILKTRDARMIPGEPDKAEATLGYIAKGKADLNFVFSGGSGSRQEQVVKDRLGSFTTVTHSGNTQVAPLDVEFPVITLVATGVLARDNPREEQIFWTSRVNSDNWGGYPPGTAKVTRVDWIPSDLAASPKEYLFTFEFEVYFYDGGHQPRGSYIDPTTGRPPTGMSASGSKRFGVYPTRPFTPQFPL